MPDAAISVQIVHGNPTQIPILFRSSQAERPGSGSLCLKRAKAVRFTFRLKHPPAAVAGAGKKQVRSLHRPTRKSRRRLPDSNVPPTHPLHPDGVRISPPDTPCIAGQDESGDGRGIAGAMAAAGREIYLAGERRVSRAALGDDRRRQIAPGQRPLGQRGVLPRDPLLPAQCIVLGLELGQPPSPFSGEGRRLSLGQSHRGGTAPVNIEQRPGRRCPMPAGLDGPVEAVTVLRAAGADPFEQEPHRRAVFGFDLLSR